MDGDSSTTPSLLESRIGGEIPVIQFGTYPTQTLGPSLPVDRKEDVEKREERKEEEKREERREERVEERRDERREERREERKEEERREERREEERKEDRKEEEKKEERKEEERPAAIPPPASRAPTPKLTPRAGRQSQPATPSKIPLPSRNKTADNLPPKPTPPKTALEIRAPAPAPTPSEQDRVVRYASPTQRPRSPRDNTQIKVKGTLIDRKDIPPIVNERPPPPRLPEVPDTENRSRRDKAKKPSSPAPAVPVAPTSSRSPPRASRSPPRTSSSSRPSASPPRPSSSSSSSLPLSSLPLSSSSSLPLRPSSPPLPLSLPPSLPLPTSQPIIDEFPISTFSQPVHIATDDQLTKLAWPELDTSVDPNHLIRPASPLKEDLPPLPPEDNPSETETDTQSDEESALPPQVTSRLTPRVVYVRKVKKKAIPDFSNLPLYQQMSLRSKLRTNIIKVKNRCPQYADWFPDFDYERDPLERLHAFYENCLIEAKKEMKLLKYKLVIVGICAAVEFIGCKYLHLPLKYFMTDSLRMLSFYEYYLTDISAKSTVSFGDGWSPEMKLIVLMLVNAAIYLGLGYFFIRNGYDPNMVIQGKNQIISLFVGAPTPRQPFSGEQENGEQSSGPTVSPVTDDLTQPDLMGMFSGFMRNFTTGFRGTGQHHARPSSSSSQPSSSQRAPRDPPFMS